VIFVFFVRDFISIGMTVLKSDYYMELDLWFLADSVIRFVGLFVPE